MQCEFYFVTFLSACISTRVLHTYLLPSLYHREDSSYWKSWLQFDKFFIALTAVFTSAFGWFLLNFLGTFSTFVFTDKSDIVWKRNVLVDWKYVVVRCPKSTMESRFFQQIELHNLLGCKVSSPDAIAGTFCSLFPLYSIAN